MSECPINGSYSQAHSVSLSEKGWRESVRQFLSYLPAETGTFLASAVSLWALADVVAAAANAQLPVERLAIPVLLFSLAVSMYRAYRRYSVYVPDALKSETAQAHFIFRKQRVGWNAALAHELLTERIRRAEATLERIRRGSEYIEPRRIERDKYLCWLSTRPEAMLRLVHSAMALCTIDVPDAMGTTTSEGDLPALRDEIEALAEAYNAAKDLEVECHQLVPPEGLEAIHEMTYGWTDTIRDGVRQFCRLLEQIARIDRKEVMKGTASLPPFNITIGAPDNIDEFCRRLEQLSG